MKKKKTDFEAKFWSGTRKHTAINLLETFFQFNDLAATKETLNEMVQSSVQKNTRIAKEPAEIFYLYQSLRSFTLVSHHIARKARKGKFKNSTEVSFPKTPISLSEKEQRNPLRVFQNAFKVCTLQDFDDFLSATAYFSLGNFSCDTEKKIIIPYFQLIKLLEAAPLIVENCQKKMKG
ncbi:hypothetical protein [Chryseobacterium sp. VD8]|uniref:hypothetical protein n=1 Tax=Chryseobacterium sp. VD8 TaxID=3081254 RepID=UPI00301806B7